MIRKAAIATTVVPAASPAASPDDEGAVEALRRRLASGSARDHVVLDFLEDDLRESRNALAGVAAWLANVEHALADGDPSQQQILSAALGGRPGERIDELSQAIASVRRRLAQVAARM
ncbi:MAG TPA: hypothetical protein VF912_11790 [Anaeromyxobacter sp.]